MKKLQMVLMVLVISSTSSCWDDAPRDPIVGRWEMTMARASSGAGPVSWVKPRPPETASFQRDGTFDLGDGSKAYLTNYEIIIPDSLMAVFSIDRRYYAEFVYHIKDNELYLRPGCYEGCEYKYRKIFKLTP